MKIDFKPQYCLLPLNRRQNNTISFQIGVCVPDTCTSNQVQQVMNAFFNQIGYESNITMDPCIDTTPGRFGTLEKVAIGTVIGLLIMLLVSTLYDVIQKYRKGKKWSKSYTIFEIKYESKLFQPKQSLCSLPSHSKEIFRTYWNQNMIKTCLNASMASESLQMVGLSFIICTFSLEIIWGPYQTQKIMKS